MSFVSFSCFIALIKIPSTMVKKNMKSRYLCLVLNLRAKAFGLSPFSIMLAIGFLVDFLYQVEEMSPYA